MRPVQMFTFPAPSAGWVKNSRLIGAPPEAAEVLDDIFPTATGARLRSGKLKHATITGELKSMFVYRSGSKQELFAASAAAVYDVTNPADPAVSPTAEFSGMSGGDWVAAQFANAAGEFVFIVNGEDTPRYYNGTSWTVTSITGGGGVTPADLSSVFVHKERLFFVEGGTQNVYYFPVNTIDGEITKFAVQGVFNLGGSILFGATWSQDTGEGIDDFAAFVTTEGEVAVYAGTDPSSATTWALQGVYRIGRPLGKNSWYKVGGELMILTEDGITALSSALRKDRAQLQSDSVSFLIEDAWRDVVAQRSGSYNFSGELWHSQSLLLIGVPVSASGSPVAFVANSRTGAWCRFRNWQVDATGIINDALYFGTAGASSSIIYRADTTGSDDGTAIEGRWVPKFQEGDGRQKAALHARVRGRGGGEYNVSLKGFADYVIGEYPTPTPTTEEFGAFWGSVAWGSFVWGGDNPSIRTSKWRTIRAVGSSLAPAVVAATNRTSKNDLEFIAVDVVFETGAML
jgi:hypothetical protein